MNDSKSFDCLVFIVKELEGALWRLMHSEFSIREKSKSHQSAAEFKRRANLLLKLLRSSGNGA